MRQVLVTGGSGFFGEILLRRLLDEGYHCTSIDLRANPLRHPNLTAVQGDIRDAQTLEGLFSKGSFSAVCHCAAVLAHGRVDRQFLWTSNVDGTRRIAEAASRYGVLRVVFTSSNCLWARNFKRPVTEDDTPDPVEIYGRSKWEGEKILLDRDGRFDAVVLRCPTIIDEGRLGLLAILFEFIEEGRCIWTVGRGDNRYQFIYAKDLTTAFLRAIDYSGTEVFNIGSDRVQSLRHVYEYVIAQTGSRSRVASLPKGSTIALMKLAHWLRLSPLGPYHYKMIAEDFLFDTTKIKSRLSWTPTLTNEEMLLRAYVYYRANRQEIGRRVNVSAHKQAARMGIIRLLKMVS